MITRLTKHGSEYVIVLEHPLLDALNIGPDTPLEVSISKDRALIIRRASAETPSRAETLETSLERTNARYGSALEKLSK